MCTKSDFESENDILQKVDYKHRKTDNFRRTAYQLGSTRKRYIVVEYFFKDGNPCEIDRSGRQPQLKSHREANKKTIDEIPMLRQKAMSSVDMPRNQAQVKMLVIKRKLSIENLPNMITIVKGN